MAERSEKEQRPQKSWPAESDIEAYRKSLEASFSVEEANLEARRLEILARLDEMEANTLEQAEKEEDTLKAKLEAIMVSIQAILDDRAQAFVAGFDEGPLLEELAQESMSRLRDTGKAAGEGTP